MAVAGILPTQEEIVRILPTQEEIGFGEFGRMGVWRKIRQYKIYRKYRKKLRSIGLNTYKGTKWVADKIILPRASVLAPKLHALLFNSRYSVPSYYARNMMKYIGEIYALLKRLADKVRRTKDVTKRRIMVIWMINALKTLEGVIHSISEVRNLDAKRLQILRHKDSHLRYISRRLHHLVHKY